MLRVVTRQVDRDARARWIGGVLDLRSTCDLDSLETFLLDRYTPSPVVSPWNGGSGFFPNDRRWAIESVAASKEARLQPFARAIETARAILAGLDLYEKPSGDAKIALIRALRRRLADDAVEWIDASVALTGTGVSYPPLLGSGGNDGRFDFANNYAQQVLRTASAEASRDQSTGWLKSALAAESVSLEAGLSLAHLLRDASPVNSPRGESDSLGNPWDLVLAVEGTLMLAAGSARRHGSAVEAHLVGPFTARATAAGFGSAVSGESGRAELWLPLWTGWASAREVEALARESRAQVGRRSARTGLDFARASGELGVARGVDGFERYSILERAGQSSLAVPVGRIDVTAKPAVAAIQSLDAWLDRLLSFANGKRCPQAPRRAIRDLERSLFTFADRGRPQDALSVVEQLGVVETTLSRSVRRVLEADLRPPRAVLAPPWIAVADDGSAEFSVAVCIASVRDRHPRLPALRDYLHGTSVESSGARRYEPDPDTLISRASGPVGRLATLHARRHRDAQRVEGRLKHSDSGRPGPRTSLRFELAMAADPDCARLFAAGEVDDGRILRLVEGFSLLDFGGAELPHRLRRLASPPTPAFDLMQLAWWGSPEIELFPRPGWVARLAAHSVEPVLRDVLLRLRLAGLPPVPSVQDLASQELDGPRLAAALLIRPSIAERRRVARRLTLPSATAPRPFQQEEEDDRAA